MAMRRMKEIESRASRERGLMLQGGAADYEP